MMSSELDLFLSQAHTGQVEQCGQLAEMCSLRSLQRVEPIPGSYAAPPPPPPQHVVRSVCDPIQPQAPNLCVSSTGPSGLGRLMPSRSLGRTFYTFIPHLFLSKVLRKAREDRARMILIAPGCSLKLGSAISVTSLTCYISFLGDRTS